jgi:hypothetical protein
MQAWRFVNVIIEVLSRFVNELVRKTKVAPPMDDSMHLLHREGRFSGANAR